MVNKRLINTGVEAAPAVFDPLQNFETVTYTGNGGTQKITGYIRKGGAFNGSSSNIIASVTNSVIDSINSVSFWFNVSSLSSINSLLNIGNLTSNGSPLRVRFESSSQKLRFIVHNSSNTSESILSTTTISANTWYHIAAVWTGSQWKMYLNGVNEVDTSSTTSRVSAAGNEIYIGENDGIYNPLNGKIDQVRFFNKALDSSEVTTLYNETYDSSTKSTTDIFGDGSGIALYELDEDANDTGGTYNGTPTNVNFLGMAFQPDFVIIKNRTANGAHWVSDVVRGAGKGLQTQSTSAEITSLPELMSSFDSNGFTVGYISNNTTNYSGYNYVAWCWKAGGAAVSNTDGSITSTVSANQDAGFSIVKINNGSSNTFTFGTGLNQSPELIITKSITSASGWTTWYSGLSTNQYLYLNTTDQVQTYGSDLWNLSAWDGLGLIGATSSNFNNNLDTIAYCFHSVDGYQKVGSYTGTGAAGNAQDVGFAPRFVMVKRTDSASGWLIIDDARGNGHELYPHSSSAELSSAEGGIYDRLSLNSSGFEFNGSAFNESGSTWIYLAIA